MLCVCYRFSSLFLSLSFSLSFFLALSLSLLYLSLSLSLSFISLSLSLTFTHIPVSFPTNSCYYALSLSLLSLSLSFIYLSIYLSLSFFFFFFFFTLGLFPPSAAPQLSENEIQQVKNLMRRTENLAEQAAKRNVRLMIDAEQTYFQPAIDHVVLQLQRKFNRVEERVDTGQSDREELGMSRKVRSVD